MLFQFELSGSIQYVSTTAGGASALYPTSSSVTITAWVNASSTSGFQWIVSMPSQETSAHDAYSLYISAVILVFDFWEAGQPFSQTVSTPFSSTG